MVWTLLLLREVLTEGVGEEGECLEVEAEVGLRLPAGLQHRAWGPLTLQTTPQTVGHQTHMLMCGRQGPMTLQMGQWHGRTLWTSGQLKTGVKM